MVTKAITYRGKTYKLKAPSKSAEATGKRYKVKSVTMRGGKLLTGRVGQAVRERAARRLKNG